MAKKRLPLVVSIQLVLALTLGCGSSNMMAPPPPPPPKAEFLYVMTVQPPSNAQLLAFKLDLATGTLSSPSTTATPLTPGVAVDPASKFLYVSDPNPVAPAIDIFSIDPKTGSLTPDGAIVLTHICPFCPPISTPGALAMESKGQFLYYGSNFFGPGVSEVIGGLSVNAATGALNEVPNSPFPADDVPYAVLVDPSGHFVYTENMPNLLVFPFHLQSVSGFSIDASTGALAPMPGSPFIPPVNADLTGIAIHPTGKFTYASTGTTANGILGWSIDSTTGALMALPASPFAVGTTPIGVTIDPAGKFLYASNGASEGILGFTIDAASGVLNPMSGSPFDRSVVSLECVIDPSGKLLAAVDARNKAITLFSIDSSTGALTQVGSSTSNGGISLSLVMAKAPQ
jgi:6-phosphogluconolactonase